MATLTVTETMTVTAPKTYAEMQALANLVNTWTQVIVNFTICVALGALMVAVYYHGDALGAFIVELFHGHRGVSERQTVLAVIEAIRQAKAEAGEISEGSDDSDESEKTGKEGPCVVVVE